MLPPGATLGVDSGSGSTLPAALDDSIPLPIPARTTATPQGDVRLEPAGGNPFFLAFAGGAYFPPQGELVDPELLSSLRSVYVDGRPTPTAYAFVMFERRIVPERLAELELAGARVLGFHPWYCVKVAVPPMLLDQVAALPFVHWVGAPRAWQKVHPELAKLCADRGASEPIEVYVSVYESDLGSAASALPEARPVYTDGGALVSGPEPAPSTTRFLSHGWQQRALEGVGLEVSEYADSLRTFRGRVPAGLVPWLVALDFVQFVEPVPTPTLDHDESTPMVYTDLIRSYYDGGISQTVVSGQFDSGLDFTHDDLWIDGVGWDLSGSGTGTFHDGCGHGTHVNGTLMGRGVVSPQLRGNAPGLADRPFLRHFHVKIFDDACSYGGATMAQMISPVSSSFFDGTYTTPRPHLLNNSWGTCCGGYLGTETSARAIDDQVYSTGQLWIFSSGNTGGAGSINLEGNAKNAFTVGSVDDYRSASGDPGTLSSFSSQGPTGDGRWKPNVVAPGDWIESLLAHSSTGYTKKYGTSMAVPHVAGVAAMVLDSATYQQYAAERTESLLMATALTKADALLTYPTDTHLDQYGAGRVDAYRALYGTTQMGWQNWGGYLAASSWAYGDFTVGAGATRLVVCMNYSEPAAAAGAAQALVSNFDLWIDADPIDPAGNTGDYYVQQSANDNTEIRSFNGPPAGPWRWKIWPTSATTGVYYGVTVAVIYGDTTPAATIDVASNDAFVKPNETVQVTATVANPAFVASAVYLDATTLGNVSGSRKSLGLDAYADMGGQTDMELGNIMHGWDRTAEYDVSWPSEGLRSFKAEARADNIATISETIYVTVDGTPPALPTNLHSTSHTPNVWSNDIFVDFAWVASTDNLSGLAGYGTAVGFSPTAPAEVQDLGAITAYTVSFASAGSGYYFSLKPVDLCDNWNASYVAVGPYLIDAMAPVGPSGLASPTHTLSVPSCNATITVQWTAGTDSLSGLKGYAYVWDHTAATNLTGSATNLAAGATSRTSTLASSSLPYYFHLIAQDNALNYGTTKHLGPFYIDTNPTVVTSCPPKVNSAGCTPIIGWTGAPIVSQTSGFVVSCANVLANKSGLLFYGINGPANLPFQGGTLCVAAPIKRTPPVNSGGGAGCTGLLKIDFSAFAHGLLGGTPLPELLVPGKIVHLQWWSRDPGFLPPNNTNLSGSLRVTTCE